jgi:hypothetical protein
MSAVPNVDGSSFILESSEGIGVSGRLALAEGNAMSVICTSVGLPNPDCLWVAELVGDGDVAGSVPENSRSEHGIVKVMKIWLTLHKPL